MGVDKDGAASGPHLAAFYEHLGVDVDTVAAGSFEVDHYGGLVSVRFQGVVAVTPERFAEACAIAAQVHAEHKAVPIELQGLGLTPEQVRAEQDRAAAEGG